MLALLAATISGDAAAPFTGNPAAEVKWHPGHYIFVGHGAIREEHLTGPFRGVQKCYTWKALEPELGQYDFSAVKADLALLQKRGRQLVMQVQFKAFGQGACYAPAYLKGPEFGGGVYRASSGSYNPVIWNRQTGERLDALLAALGKELDNHPALEAVVLPETAPSANLNKQPQAGVEPYADDKYLEALKLRVRALRTAFPRTAIIQYANFPPDLLPDLVAYMKEIGVGMGGPDVYPLESNLSDPKRGVYRLYAGLSGIVPLGAAVQSPNYSRALKKRTSAFDRGQDPKAVVLEPGDETPIPVREHLKLAQDRLKLNYLFWSGHPKDCFEAVKKMLAEPGLAADPAGGLDAKLPAKTFVK